MLFRGCVEAVRGDTWVRYSRDWCAVFMEGGLW